MLYSTIILGSYCYSTMFYSTIMLGSYCVVISIYEMGRKMEAAKLAAELQRSS